MTLTERPDGDDGSPDDPPAGSDAAPESGDTAPKAGSDAAPESGDTASDGRTSTVRQGKELDRLAGLEEERRFLLRSLTDLEREYEAGDVEDDDYRTLKDGYTVRAAVVLRQIEAGRRQLVPRRPRRWGSIVAVSLAVVLGAAGIGVVLAQAWGERGANDEITGFTPGDEVRQVLANARAALSDGRLDIANDLFRQAIDLERARGQENPEALTYFAWTLALGSVGNPDTEQAARVLDATVLALAQAIETDPTYPDAHCLLAIVEFRFRDDAEAARPHVERCRELNPPASVAELVDNLAIAIEEASGD